MRPPLKKSVWQAAQRCTKMGSPLYGSPARRRVTGDSAVEISARALGFGAAVAQEFLRERGDSCVLVRARVAQRASGGMVRA